MKNVDLWTICRCDLDIGLRYTDFKASEAEKTFGEDRFSMNDLYFCPECNELKCEKCTRFKLSSKFCPNCFSTFEKASTARCLKNCFCCPLCDSPLNLNITDTTLDGKRAKIFSFACTYCTYTYNTNPVARPMPIHKVIRSEAEGSEKLASDYFQQLKDYYKKKLRLNKLKCLADRQRISHHKKGLSQEIIKKFKDLELSNLAGQAKDIESEMLILQAEMDSTLSVNLEIAQDYKDALGSSDMLDLSNYLDIKNQSDLSAVMYSSMENINSPHTRLVHHQNYPMRRKLRGCYSISCLTCGSCLYSPLRDVRATNFSILQSAADYLPSIRASLIKRDVSLARDVEPVSLHGILTLLNPQAKPLEVRLTTPSELILRTENMNIKVDVLVPVEWFVLGPNLNSKDRHSIVTNIPTKYLTNHTPLSQHELSKRRSSKPEDRVRIGDITSLNIDSFSQSKGNWCLLPFSIKTKDSKYDLSNLSEFCLTVPFFIEMRTKSQGLLESSSESQFSYSYVSGLNVENLIVK